MLLFKSRTIHCYKNYQNYIYINYLRLGHEFLSVIMPKNGKRKHDYGDCNSINKKDIIDNIDNIIAVSQFCDAVTKYLR